MATLKDIWDYPNNPGSGYVADTANWSGDESYGLDQRLDQLLDGTYKSWPNLDPVADLSQTVDTVSELYSKFKNYVDSYDSSEHLSFYKLHRYPVVVATKKLIDSETITAANVDSTSALITVSGTHEFEDGMKVTIASMDGSWADIDGADYYASDVDNSGGTLKLRAGSAAGPYVRFYDAKSANITGTTSGVPVTFTDASHDLVNDIEVTISGFDGSLSEYNGNNYYVKNVSGSTFNLSWDSGGTELLDLQASYTGVSIDEFRLQEDNSIIVKATNTPDFLNRSVVEFATGTLGEPISTDLNAAGVLYLETTGTADEYKIYTDAALTTPYSWRDLTTANFDVQYPAYYGSSPSATITGGKLRLDTAISTSVSKLVSGPGQDLDLIDKNTVYYTDSNGDVYTDSGLTTALDVTHYALPFYPVYTGYADLATTAYDFKSRVDDDNGDQVPSNAVIVDTTGITTANISGLSYEYEPDNSAVGTLTDTGDTAFSDTDNKIYTASVGHPTYNKPSSGTTYVWTNNRDVYNTDSGAVSIPIGWNTVTAVLTGSRTTLVVDDASHTNALFNEMDTRNTAGTLLGNPIILGSYNTSTSDSGRAFAVPYYKATTGAGDAAFWCFIYEMDEYGNPTDPSPSPSTTGDFLYNETNAGSRFKNPVWTNGTSSADTFSWAYQSGRFYTDTYYKTGTIVDLEGDDYVLFYNRTYLGNYEYVYFPWDGSDVDFTTIAPSLGGALSGTGSTNQLTYFDTVSHTGYDTSTDLLLYQRFNDNISAVLLDPDTYAGTTLDITAGNTDSTTGKVLEVAPSGDAGQFAFETPTAATTGSIAPATSDPYRYEIDTVSIKMPGAVAYTYKDVSNVTQYGAEVDSTVYWGIDDASATSYASSGETAAQFTVGVDASGYLNSISLTEEVDAEGRYADGDDIAIVIKALDDAYVAPTPYAEDVWDTDDEWDSDAYSALKVWPTHVAPVGAKITTTQPSSITRSQNGTKYVRSSGVIKQQLEVTYPPMTYDDFREFEAVVEAARGQATPFYFNVKGLDSPNRNILFQRTDALKDGGLSSPYSVRLKNAVAVGDKTVLVEGFPANQSDVFIRGEYFINDFGYANGDLSQVINDNVDSNAFGEAKIRMPYGARVADTAGDRIYKNPSHVVVTLADDEFEYNVGTDLLYRFTVRFDFDEWK